MVDHQSLFIENCNVVCGPLHRDANKEDIVRPCCGSIDWNKPESSEVVFDQYPVLSSIPILVAGEIPHVHIEALLEVRARERETIEYAAYELSTDK